MSNLFFSNQTNLSLLSNQKRIEEISSFGLNDTQIMVCVRQGYELIGYEYLAATENWKIRWNETIFNPIGHYPMSHYPWLVFNKLVTNKNVFMVYHPDGVRLYQSDLTQSRLQLLAEDGNFHEVYGWSHPDHILMFGKFYPNLNETGVISRNARGEVKFYAVIEASFQDENKYNPLFLLDKELFLTEDWSAVNTEFFLTNLLHREPKVVVLRTSNGLEFYQFDDNYILRKIANTSKITKPLNSNLTIERLFFADLTHQLYQDILYLNSSGLHVYQYNTTLQDYMLLHKHTAFSQSYGWLPSYSDSIKLADINRDNRDDLIFTGPMGLTALTFDTKTVDWKMLLNPAHLSGKQRYATVVGTLPPIPPIILEPSLFTQDADGKVQWAKIMSEPITTTAATLVPPEITPYYAPWPKNKLIPEQTTRKSLAEKPLLRWTEQWDVQFFKDVVDTASGQVRFRLPMIDISTTTSWNLQLELFYHSQAATSDLLGEGWSIPLAKDYIMVDHQGSIYPGEAHYYLMIQGQRHRLKFKALEMGKYIYQLAESVAESSMTIEYHMIEQRWIIEGTDERVIYGAANQVDARDAIQWSLGWPSWRGPGHEKDKEKLQPLAAAWYLNARVAKQSQRVLFYDYESNEQQFAKEKYTAALRLKTIRDNHQLRLVLNYAAKTTEEYTIPNPIDGKDNIVFPVPLANSHYLDSYCLTTADYSQTLQFIYKIDQGKRLLTSILQPLLSYHEVVLQFSYEGVLGKQLLASCSSTGSTVNFVYETVTPPSYMSEHNTAALIYPVRERTKIAYGPDYAIMAYRDLNQTAGKVVFRIMNREMNKIICDCSVDVELSCPSIQSEITDFILQAYHDFFVVLIENKEKRVLYFFERREQIWVSEPIFHSFSKTALILFGEMMIAVADSKDRNLSTFERIANKSVWSTIALNRPLTRLALHNGLIVGYDDHQVRLFYRDPHSHWNNEILASNLEGFQKFLNCFDLCQETRQSVLETLNQNGLQIFNNFIVFNSLQENNGQLSSRIHLFLLDDRYRISKKQYIDIKQENISDLTYDLEHENSTYTLKYVKEKNLFRINIDTVSGKAVEDIQQIGNKNIKQDEMKKRINQLNKLDGWKDFFRKNLLINEERYYVKINQRGVYCKDIFYKVTGTGWELQTLPSVQLTPLGDSFVLESSNDQKLLKIYAQDGNKNKQGSSLEEFRLFSPGLVANRYPAYIAYQLTIDSTRVLTFKDPQTIGQWHTFNHEQLLLESDWQNLLTLANASSTSMAHSAPQECRLRPTFTLSTTSKPQVYVSKTQLTDGKILRLTGFQRTFSNDPSRLTYSETAILIPAANKTKSGWYEATRTSTIGSSNFTETEHWFNAEGKPVLVPYEQKSKEQSTNKTNSTTEEHPAMLFDRTGKWLISDFSPYNLTDEMAAYYGFESYENNLIGLPVSRAKTWRLVDSEIIEKGFAFTGENYLQLNGTAFLEGVLKPRDQTITYLATCWLRCTTPLRLNEPTSLFKVILSTTDGQKIIGLHAQTKRISGDWSYLELPIDFQLVRQIYQDYYNYTTASNTSNMSLPSSEKVRFTITLRVAADQHQRIDLDHIRFSPLTQDFQATVYHPLTGQTTAILQGNGLVTKTLYNRLQKDIAGLQEDGDIERFSSTTRTGKLVPSPVGSTANQKKATLTFEPRHGFYENFDAYALRNRWQIDSPADWNIAPGQLWHLQSKKHRILANPNLFDKRSSALRCFFALQKSLASLSLNWYGIGSLQLIRKYGDFSTLVLPNGHLITPLPLTGELIVMLDKNYIWLWLDGVLLDEQELSKSTVAESISPWSAFYLEAQGEVMIEDCLVMNHPKLTIEYHNNFGDKTQVIQLVDVNTILVTETLYDELGREAITSKTTRITRSRGESILAYRSSFVINKNPAEPPSVWHTGKLQGEVDRLNPDDQGVCYVRTEYAKNPLNEKSALGLPGSEFSITGRYAIKFGVHSGISLLENLFPDHRGYRQTVEYKSNGSQTIEVFDRHGNKVARYVQVPSYNHLLTTFEYDMENRLIKILPPLYHENVDTASKIISWQSNEFTPSNQEKKWQQDLATFFFYDDQGNLIRKITPDTGTTEYLYNTAGQRRFMFSVDQNNQTSAISFYNYEINGQLVETGFIKKPLSIETLPQYLESSFVPDSEVYQRIDFSDDDPDPKSRGRIKRFITDNEKSPVVEEVIFNAQQQIISKSTLSTIAPDEADMLLKFTKQYVGSQLQTLSYPLIVDGKPFTLLHRTNRLGQIVELGTSDQPARYARFSYSANGHLDSEHYQPDTPYQFTRNYRYNSPGFLVKISDPFLTEEISYTEKGYGQAGYGDGMVMQTAFNASWPKNADGRWFHLDENDLEGDFPKQCIYALQRTGYLTTNNKPVRLYLRETETDLPLVCNKQIMAQRIAEKQLPRYYGHRYAYGNHQELVKAKYFTDETVSFIDPLQPNSFFKEIPDLTNQQSKHIWQLLTNAGYVIVDQQRYDAATAIGKPGKSFFRDTELLADLKSLNTDFTLYLGSIKQLLMAAISLRKTLSLADFTETFLNWTSASTISKKQQEQMGQEVGNMLISKGYLHTDPFTISKVLDKKFISILADYYKFIPEIVRVLSKCFSQGLGNTAFDVESYKIDANGNHRLFYTGFNRYEFTYRNATNQIQYIKSGWDSFLHTAKSFAMKHDAQGNVIQALHIGIETIEYHPTSQRTTRIKMTDGRTLHFYYDAQGERVLKRVLTATGKLSRETYYLRDEKGRVLVDHLINYLPSQPAQKTVTAYLYGPRELLGFIRNDKFYSVMTDHTGSIRLVLRDGQVVAAYDYLPYGKLMRSFGSDPQCKILYRFTGQEWDEETGLYNYHARLYDPTIGRFYQPDPQSQYFSPYKYAGNSPVSLIDPDGEFAFLIAAIIGVIAGTYIGGATANNRWNPANWDFKHVSTWIGMGGGALAGGLLPMGVAGSVATIGSLGTVGIGLGGSYLTAAAANKNWAPWKWEWDRPYTYNALFQGFSSGTGVVNGVSSIHNFASRMSFLKKTLFLTVSYSSAGALTYVQGAMSNDKNFAFWEWDFSNPATWSALVDGFDTGMGWPQNVIEIKRGIEKLAQNPRNLGSILGKEASKRQKFMAILKNPKHPFYKLTSSVVMAYFMGSSANDNLDITRWNLASFSTYESVLNGIFFGKDASNMLNFARESKLKKSSNKLMTGNKHITNWYKDLVYTLENVQYYHKKQEYQRLVGNCFSSDTWRSKLKDKPDSLKRKVENFLKLGVESWEKGKINPPEEFRKLLLEEAEKNVQGSLRQLIEWQNESEQLFKKPRKIFPDEKTEFLRCSGGARRKKRGVLLSTGCVINSGEYTKNFKDYIDLNVVSDSQTNIIKNFPRNIADFCKRYPITTRTSDFFTSRTNLINGDIYDFFLYPLRNGGYGLLPSTNFPIFSDFDNKSPTFKGYWLNTGGKLEIKQSDSTRFIFTSELQGCYLYIKFSPESKVIEFYHHLAEENHEYGRKRIAELDKEYGNEHSRIFKHDQYMLGVKNSDNNHDFVTPIIYRDNNHWNIFFQKISYENPMDPFDSLKLNTNHHNSFLLFEYSRKKRSIDLEKNFSKLSLKNLSKYNPREKQFLTPEFVPGRDRLSELGSSMLQDHIFLNQLEKQKLRHVTVNHYSPKAILDSELLLQQVTVQKRSATLDCFNGCACLWFQSAEGASVLHNFPAQQTLTLNGIDYRIIKDQLFAIDAPNGLINGNQLIRSHTTTGRVPIRLNSSFAESTLSLEQNSFTINNLTLRQLPYDTLIYFCEEVFTLKDLNDKLQYQSDYHRCDEIPAIKPLASGAAQNILWTSQLMKQLVGLFSGFRWELPALSTSQENSSNQSLVVFSSGPGKSTPQSNMIGEYTVSHLQGGLQLVDLLIRKVTGEHYQCSGPTPPDPMDESEERLKASLRQWAGFSTDD